MVKSETRQDAEILVKNSSPIRLFGKKFESQKSKNKPCKNETSRLIKLMLSRFRDPAKILRDPRFSRYHSPPLRMLNLLNKAQEKWSRGSMKCTQIKRGVLASLIRTRINLSLQRRNVSVALLMLS